ncbi:MAG: DUF4198 domain-containing protein [Nonlabens sp.]|jgi:uncharacterized GH25 family protein|uniref:DUF4198 domain-containing protein n=1 Tax=Nonlabens sp. TaxID=1888209 RepID=UPI0032191164
MRKKLILGCVAILLLCSHDMFLKLDSYFLLPNSDATIQLFNGTFEESENTIDRNRMLDVSLISNGTRTVVDSSQWMEKDLITYLNFKTGNEGTYVAGVSTAARNIEMKADRFNNYLEHDGVVDMLNYRKENNEVDEDAVEKYSKHVKTIFQVGDKTSDDWKTVLNYPIEFVPLENPYELHKGHHFKARLLLNGNPLKDQLVSVGNKNAITSSTEEHSHGDGEKHSHSMEDKEEHTHDALMELRTDKNGDVDFEITSSGVWFLKTIHMEKSIEDGLTHESNWATLTFEIGSGHSHGDSSHSHSHSHENDDHAHEHEDEGMPSYLFWIGSVLIVAVLFFIFNRRKTDV